MFEEIPRGKLYPSAQSVLRHILLEDRPNLRQIESDAREMWVRASYLDGQVALRRSDIDKTAMVLPRKPFSYREVRRMAQPGHCFEKFFQARRISVQRRKKWRAAALRLVLRLTRAERLGQPIPKPEQSKICHFEHAANVGLLAFAQELVHGRSVVINAVFAFQESEGNECVEEVASRSWMQAQLAL